MRKHKLQSDINWQDPLKHKK